MTAVYNQPIECVLKAH